MVIGLLAAPWLEGSVRLDDRVPPQTAVDMAADPACQRLRAPEPPVDREHLHDVFVWLEAPPSSSPPPSEPAVLTLDACRFRPRVLGMQRGQVLSILNRDPTLHHVQAEGLFDWVLPRQGDHRSLVMDRARVMFELRDATHPWMHGYVGVVPHPYFDVTGSDGRFSIDVAGLPPGEIRLRFWHVWVGPRVRTVVLMAEGRDPEPVHVTFTRGEPGSLGDPNP
jgi:hypothetical protein